MPRDLLNEGAAWLARKQKEYASTEIEYRRGNSSIWLRATRGRSVFEETDAQGFITKTETQDFIVQADDLEIDSLPTVPLQADRIHDGDNIFEVMTIGSEPCFRYTDEHRLQLRIHVKKVSEVP